MWKFQDKAKKMNHQWISGCYATTQICDVCNKPLSNKPALYCESKCILQKSFISMFNKIVDFQFWEQRSNCELKIDIKRDNIKFFQVVVQRFTRTPVKIIFKTV